MGNRKNRKTNRRTKRKRASSSRKYKRVLREITCKSQNLSEDIIASATIPLGQVESLESSSTNNFQNNAESNSPSSIEEIHRFKNELVESSKNLTQDLPSFGEFDFPEVSFAELLESQLPEINFEINEYATYLNIYNNSNL